MLNTTTRCQKWSQKNCAKLKNSPINVFMVLMTILSAICFQAVQPNKVNDRATVHRLFFWYPRPHLNGDVGHIALQLSNELCISDKYTYIHRTLLLIPNNEASCSKMVDRLPDKVLKIPHSFLDRSKVNLWWGRGWSSSHSAAHNVRGAICAGLTFDRRKYDKSTLWLGKTLSYNVWSSRRVFLPAFVFHSVKTSVENFMGDGNLLRFYNYKALAWDLFC